MSINVLMHINALQATEASRVKFFEALKENLWIRMHAIYTTWCCRYSRDVLDVPEQVMAEVKALAAEAGVTAFHAVAQCGTTSRSGSSTRPRPSSKRGICRPRRRRRRAATRASQPRSRRARRPARGRARSPPRRPACARPSSRARS